MRFPPEVVPERLLCQLRREASSAGPLRSGEKRQRSQRWQLEEYLRHVEMFPRRWLNRFGTLARPRGPLRPERLQLFRDTLRAIRRGEGSFPRRHRCSTGPNYVYLPGVGCRSHVAGPDLGYRSLREIPRPAAKRTWTVEGFAHWSHLADGLHDDALPRPGDPSVRRDCDRPHGRNAGPGGRCHDHGRDRCRNAGNSFEWD